MKICVLIKQVPATDKVKIDEKTGTMVRSEMEAELNPLDMYAVEEAVRIKERLKDAHITVITMGPPSASDAIKDAISIGCDDGYLLTDRRFAGADTWATAYTLSAAIKKIGGFDLVLCGERATDGETGQVGPSVGSQMGIPVLTYVSEIVELTDKYVRVKRAIEGGHEIVEVDLPALISVVKEINDPRIPNLSGKLKAKSAQVKNFDAISIEADQSKIGLGGSPTRVVKVFYPKLTRSGQILRSKDPQSAAKALLNFLKSKEII
ncbi:electron transfer flavoprotein subunit beta/FixA family protein [Athalassotoga saccharophila]|uniref:electron transfer flavoprotein subunit beta/FixA family protein n=1 Tax=Athalassotoga saccharophila TaxID=1441386 RepID=UPI0015802916|nr:electron transfer flavoprotein subunit beta/FixA family protein [Athalassotoga saccharophila]BBJ27369.1 electron transfer flavoprotein, beta subunit [Athalassotoga saccharophila]